MPHIEQNTTINTVTERNTVEFVEVRGHRIAFQRYNQDATGVPLIFLHGLSVSLRFWEAGMLDYVWQHHPWISVSLPLHYPSTAPPDFRSADFTTDLLYQGLAGVLDEVYPDRPVVLIGHSLGAAAALNYAIRAPQRVRGVVSIGGFARGRAKGLEAVLQQLTKGTFVRKSVFHAGWKLMCSHPIFLKMVISTYAYRKRALFRYPPLEPTIQAIYPDIRRHLVRHVRYVFHFLLRFDLMAELHRITAPVLTFAGRRDGIIPFSHMQAYSNKIPNGQLIAMERVGHLPFAEDPALFERELIRFLQAMQE